MEGGEDTPGPSRPAIGACPALESICLPAVHGTEWKGQRHNATSTHKEVAMWPASAVTSGVGEPLAGQQVSVRKVIKAYLLPQLPLKGQLWYWYAGRLRSVLAASAWSSWLLLAS